MEPYALEDLSTSQEEALLIHGECDSPSLEQTNGSFQPDIHPEQSRALDYVNNIRSSMGLHDLAIEPGLNNAATGHAEFIAKHGSSYPASITLHREIPGLDGFIAETYWERFETKGFQGFAVGEVISNQATARASVRQWIESVYHRIPLIHPAATHMGYGSSHQANSFMTVLEVGGDIPIANTGLIAYPPDGATNIPVSWDGIETPRPLAPSTGYPSGPVFTLTFPEENPLSITEHLLVSANGEIISHQFLQSDEDPFLGHLASVALYANDPLIPDEMYTVLISGWVGDKPFSWSSSFKTEPEKRCSPFADDCGFGQACYLGPDDTQCAWNGVIPEGQECLFQNDCTPGTTCIENTCRLLCDPKDTQDFFGCKKRCPNAYSLLSTYDEFAVCEPKSCTPGMNQCAQGESCVLGANPTCSSPGTTLAGEKCKDSSECARDLGCIQADKKHPVCLPLCDASTLAGTGYELFPSNLPPCATACPHDGFLLSDHPHLGICTY